MHLFLYALIDNLLCIDSPSFMSHSLMSKQQMHSQQAILYINYVQSTHCDSRISTTMSDRIFDSNMLLLTYALNDLQSWAAPPPYATRKLFPINSCVSM